MVEISPSAFEGLDNLLELDLSYNLLCETFSLDILSSLKRLKYLNLEGNGLTDVSLLIPDVLQSLEKLNLKNMTYLSEKDKKMVLQLNGSHVKLPTLQSLIIGHQQATIILDASYLCDAFPSLVHLYLDNVIISNLSYTLGDRCANLKTLNIPGVVVGSIPNRLSMPVLERLLINDATMKQLSIKEFISKYTSTLALLHLDISGNKVTDDEAIDLLPRLKSIQTLHMAKNDLKQVPHDLLDSMRHMDLTEMDLCGNPFNCDCTIGLFQDWILTDSRVFLKLRPDTSYTCHNPKSSSLKSVPVTSVDLKTCHYKSQVYIIVTVIIGVFIIIATAYKIRHRIFKLCHCRRVNLRFDYITNDNESIPFENKTEWLFHAYVSYPDKDGEWVYDHLVPNLEKAANGSELFKLFIRERDKILGKVEFEERYRGISQSNKTLVVLSKHFMQCKWCNWELRVAITRMIENGQETLIPVAISAFKVTELSPTTRQLLCKKTILYWTDNNPIAQQDFWEKLRAEIKKSECVNLN